jgi:hypothetical protein
MKFSSIATLSLGTVAPVLCAPAARNPNGSLRKCNPYSIFTQINRSLAERRQQLDGQLSMLTGAADKLAEIKPAKIVQVEPKTHREGAKRIKVYYGPIKVLGANVCQNFHER